MNQSHRHTLIEIDEVYHLPVPDLIYRAQKVHRRHHDPNAVQLCTLQSIKTGRCPEDCAYCPQSAHYATFVEPETLLKKEEIVTAATAAREEGASRFCMGAAWRQVPENEQFAEVLAIISAVKELDLEVCCTLGMLTAAQADRLKKAGCDVYNHNLDTSREFYGEIITTRTYDDRLRTLDYVRRAGMEVCCGGILGMGESENDRIALLCELANLCPQPESVPINALVAVPGTPLAERPFVDGIEFVRTIATARILMPQAMVRLSAGRSQMSSELQALCFLAGANSIFLGEKLLTTENPEVSRDFALFKRLGLHPLVPEANMPK